MNKYIAKFEVEIEIESKNEKTAKEMANRIYLGSDSFGSSGETKTKKCELKEFKIVN